MQAAARKQEYRKSSAGEEKFFDKNTIIVSKTDTKGIIQYANDIFLEIADYTEGEVMGKPHNILRHPDMPKCVFKLLWDRVKAGQEIFAYVKNRTKYNDYYWVFAHVTPTFNDSGTVIGIHSNRRVPERDSLEIVKGLYAKLLSEEQKHSNPKEGMEASYALLTNILEEKGMSYDEFILSI